MLNATQRSFSDQSKYDVKKNNTINSMTLMCKELRPDT